MKKTLAFIVVSIVILFASGNEALSQWIAPGTLTKAHKDLRGVTSCLKCHTLTQGLDNKACSSSSCHEKLQKKIKEKKGLHARIESDCVTCHTDHKGAEYDITAINEESFQHSLTGYELLDSHHVGCKECHTKEGTYLELKTDCLSCHADVHKKAVSEDCIQCHNYKEWKDYVFDHAKKADYKLIGKHVDVKCELCHPRERVVAKSGYSEKEYQVLKLKPIQSETCMDCHYDVHKGQFKDQKCDACHSVEKGWKEYTFKHESEKYRGYRLEGKHKDVDCEKCHARTDIKYTEFTADKKVSVGTFKPIKGKICSECHYDVHKGQFKKQKCNECHSVEKDWKDYTFDHQSEKFSYKLEGKHKDADCVKCHAKNEVTYTEFRTAKKVLISTFEKIKAEECTSCHFDIHNGEFKDQKCDACHSLEKGWKDYTFDHQSEKFSYKLEGRHKDVDCVKCHLKKEVKYNEFETAKKVVISSFEEIKADECTSCHFDIHNGQFKDQKCNSCHSLEKEWKDTTFKHEAENYKGYKLEGKHKPVECEKCHKRSEISYTEFNLQKKVMIGEFKPLKSDKCGDCHKNGHERELKGMEKLEGLTCADCHSVEKEFKEHDYKHKEDSKYHKYNLNGQVHESNCAECHYCDPNMFSISSCFNELGILPTD